MYKSAAAFLSKAVTLDFSSVGFSITKRAYITRFSYTIMQVKANDPTYNHSHLPSKQLRDILPRYDNHKQHEQGEAYDIDRVGELHRNAPAGNRFN